MFRYNLSSERADSLAQKIGYSRNGLTGWVSGTSENQHDTPNDVNVRECEMTEGESDFCIEADRYHAEFEIREDDLGVHPVLTRLRDRDFGLDIRPVPVGRETPPVDEIALEAITRKAVEIFETGVGE